LGFIRNFQELRKIRLNMDTIYAPGDVSTTTTLFGKEFALPVFAAPIGAVAMHYSEGHDDLSYSTAVLEGCMSAGSIAFTGDDVKDEVFQGTVNAIKKLGGHGIPTIKPWSVPEVLGRLRLAQESGSFAFAIDIDAAGLVMLAKLGKPVSPMPAESLRKIAASAGIPFILKGIMSPSGALKALEAGADGIVVSNHGGRVLDETPSTIEVLSDIVDVVGGRMSILVDGGFRTGLDVFKALALGADGVLIGRPFAWCVYGGGAEGVRLYLERVRVELVEAMLMTGASSIADIEPSMIC
jgi:isopentenyl diphosphate isomerase/L-lactate dehydrogenase-like FMN-dependent dehydrogenase